MDLASARDRYGRAVQLSFRNQALDPRRITVAAGIAVIAAYRDLSGLGVDIQNIVRIQVGAGIRVGQGPNHAVVIRLEFIGIRIFRAYGRIQVLTPRRWSGG